MNNKKGRISLGIIIIIIFALFLFVVTILGSCWQEKAEMYVSSQITECNDVDGDLIEGLVCYDKLECAEIFKFWNDDGCEEFIK